MPILALAWVLQRPDVACAITGASRPDQLRANAAAAGVELSADTLRAIDVALADVPVRGQTLADFAVPGVRWRTLDADAPSPATGR